ncbi:hippocampus abundant transcript-like protein 1 isoform X2 [Ricinus communis]|uniref:hippocampus abundant transcript-like protein 1 isoform X2 n=1 Tax=Ricinus communis TaxID=3988 RepID=UPI00201AEEBC|nr:hippocampus abundant transcript-like protein 1 isoform X2 [Ricinus communis]
MEKLTELSHLFVTIFLAGVAGMMVVPAITDVTMLALCPGQDECSLAIYLSGFQQAMIGVGSVVITPLIGNLSDQYGRKAMLTLPLTISIIPLAILAYSRETKFFYAYFGTRTLTAMLSDSSINCLALAYVADNVSEGRRASAFGILSGIFIAAFVCGTLVARFLTTTLTFQVATFISMLAAVYMRVFLKDKVVEGECLTQPILKTGLDDIHQDDDLPNKAPLSKKILTVGDLISLLKCSATFSQAAVVAFFHSLAEGGIQAASMYYWKARFHFTKNQFADLFLLAGLAGMISQLIFMPLLAPFVSEKKLLSAGLFMGFVTMLLYSISWSFWVPYATTALTVFVVFVTPSLRSIVSKQVGPDEQGKAQGCISSISSFANIISPLIFSPLTDDCVLSEYNDKGT